MGDAGRTVASLKMKPTIDNESLVGIHSGLDRILEDLAYLGTRHADVHYGASGDVSQVLAPDLAWAIKDRFGDHSEWYHLAHVEQLAELRGDGRSGYNAQGSSEPEYLALMGTMATRVFLVSCTGADLSSLQWAWERGRISSLVNVVEVDESATRIRILYGNAQYGTIPSIETHMHIASNAVSLNEGMDTPAVVHAHPHNTVALGMHPRIRGSQNLFNAAIFTGIEGLIRDYSELIGVVPYQPSGSAELVMASANAVRRHRFVLWMNHGVLVRGATMARAYAHLAYAEACARGALGVLDAGASPLPRSSTAEFLDTSGLRDGHTDLFGPT